MAGLFARMTDLVNNTGVVVEIREVEGDDDGEGELFATLQIGDREVIRGMKFLDRMAYLGPRSIHVTAKLATGTTKLIFPAQYFATYGRVVFRLHNQQLVVEPEEMSGIRRMRPVRLLACVWANHQNGRRDHQQYSSGVATLTVLFFGA